MTKENDIYDEIDWAKAILDFQFRGYPGTLVRLMESSSPIPAIARPWLSKIISGEIKMPDQRGKSNQKLSFEEIDNFREKLFKLYVNTEYVLIFIDELADELGIEIIDLKQRMDKLRRDALKRTASHYGISEGTVRNHIYVDETKAFAHGWAGKGDKFGNEINPLDGSVEAAKNLIFPQIRGLLAGPDCDWERIPR